ncbi:MAG TPA: serpin family protein [Gemmatimonadales bacterium]
MNRPIPFLFLLPLAAACGGSGGFEPIEELPRPLTTAETQLVDADNRFAFKLFREVNAQEEAGANVFISPLSVGMALGMTYNGAAGTTRDAMQATLELGGMTLQEVNESYQSLIALLRELDPRVTFTLANSIWYRDGIAVVPQFVNLNRQYFDAQVSALDFDDPGSVDVINGWVNDATRGKIAEIVTPPIDPLTIMFLINAIYFKGDWTQQFDKDRTRPEPFLLPDGSETSVPMMSSDGEASVRVHADADHTVLDLWYGGRAYSMTIVVPREPAAIDQLAETVTQEQWNAWVAGLDSVETLIAIPKFTLEYEVSLNAVLEALGMEIAFDKDQADFTNLYAGPERAYISKVKHKTFVDVNEEGTEAAAVTSVEIGITSAPQRLVVDRPFLFAIRENFSGAILFLGKIVHPGQ